MGRRSRKRGGPGAPRAQPAAPASPRTGPPRRRARLDEAPKPPWAPFPLVELCILVGLVLIVVGFFATGQRAVTLLAFGLVLVGLATLDLSIREHFAGFRSHTTLLAGAAGVGSGTILFALGLLGPVAPLVLAVVVFTLAWWGLRRTFRRRAGGLSFRA